MNEFSESIGVMLSALAGSLSLINTVNIGAHIGIYLSGKSDLKKFSKYNGNLIADAKFIHDKINKFKSDKLSFYKKEKLFPYMEKLMEHLSDDDKKIVCNNFETLKLKRSFLGLMSGVVGTYSAEKNKLSYSSRKSIGHEILHMASSIYDEVNNIFLCGFRQMKDNLEIGRGINEGYTELLASRIFENKVDAYKKQVKIARLLEFFFDDPREMEHLYFNCNLPGLIHHLEKFSSRQEVLDLILGLDKTLKYSSGTILSIFPTVNHIKTQVTLYEWFCRNNSDPKKLKQFEDILCENKFVSMALNKKKMKLIRENIYAYKNNVVDNSSNKRH